MEVSKCCEAEVFVAGESETHYYVCLQCWRACDVKIKSPHDNNGGSLRQHKTEQEV